MSAGLGTVPAEQTYLDVSQGNRVFDSLYDSDLPRRVAARIGAVAGRGRWCERAESAPAEIVPGLLACDARAAGEAAVAARECFDARPQLSDARSRRLRGATTS